MSLSIDVKGDMVPLANIYLAEYIPNSQANQVKISGTYNSQGLIVNGQGFNNALSLGIATALESLDQSLESRK